MRVSRKSSGQEYLPEQHSINAIANIRRGKLVSAFEATMSQLRRQHTLLCAHVEAHAIAVQQAVPADRNQAALVGTAV
jgi:hypothetical protein